MKLIEVVERLLAGAAVAGAAVYVLMNALYVEFYDDFGVRPEDVGWDRLAVLGRSAWIAFVGISVAGLIGLASLTIAARKATAAHAERQLRKEQFHKQRVDRLLGVTLLAFLVTVFVGFLLLLLQVEDEAESVRRGESVNGVGFAVVFIDVRVSRANVTWLGDKDKQPEKLGSPYLMYLGRGRDVAVLLSCARATVLVPGDEVSIDLFDVEAEGAEEEPNQEARQRQEFEMSCKEQ
jgi:hypothetical protein